MLQRVKEVQESDLRMDGALARNIQRVIAVTQADIDAAAAQGRAWVVKPVVKVSDPIDNLRGGTQLVIKQNAILPGQNVMRVIYRGGQAVVVGPGPSPLSLPGAMADDILSLTAFGGTMQGVPDGYTLLDGITGDGNAYIYLGVTLDQDDEIEIDFTMPSTATTSRSIFGYRYSASSNNIAVMVGGTGSLVCDWNNSDYSTYRFTATPTAGARYKAVLDKTGRYLYDDNGNVVASNTTACPDTIATSNVYLFYLGGNPAYTGANSKFNGTVHSVKVAGKCNLVPCKNTSNEVGMYDTLNGVFYTAVMESGTFTAGNEVVPTPTAPIDIVCNNGVLKARHESGLPLGYTLLEYIGGTGTQYIETDTKIASTDIIETEFQNSSATGYGALYGIYNTGESSAFYANQTYYGYDAANNKVNTNVSVDTDWHTAVHNFVAGTLTLDGNTTSFTPFEYTNTVNNGILARYYGGSYGYFFKGNIRKFKVVRNGVVISNMVPAKDSTDTPGLYDLITGDFWTNSGTGDLVAGNPVSDPVEVYTDGPIETIAIKDDQNTTVSTATCEDLLKFDADHTDEQDIISGTVTRKVSVLVLTGDEDGWVKGTNVTIYNLGVWSTPIQYSPDRVAVYCTHYVGTNETNSNSPDKSIKLSNSSYFSGNGTIIIKDSSCADLAAWKAFLKSQYAAGTPVIVVFPAENTTTTSVTGQPMQTAAGDNTAEITQAGMAGLELEVEYIKQ